MSDRPFYRLCRELWAAEELGAGQVVTIIPGFPRIAPAARRKRTVISAIAAGRFDAKSEAVKRPHLAVAAFDAAIQAAERYVDALPAATMTVFGVGDRTGQAELKDMAEREAGRRIKLIPARFSPDPASVVKHILQAHLAIIPSRNEESRLIGWEAIGTGTPLILSADTRLHCRRPRSSRADQGQSQPVHRDAGMGRAGKQ